MIKKHFVARKGSPLVNHMIDENDYTKFPNIIKMFVFYFGFYAFAIGSYKLIFFIQVILKLTD